MATGRERWRRVRCAWVVLHAAAVAFAAEPEPMEILRSADEARGNREGITWIVGIHAVENGRTAESEYEVRARQHDFLATARRPARQKGNQLLRVNRNMWFTKPDLSKPVPISQRQRLLGNAAYGDIAATDYAADYDATELPGEVVDGEPCRVFTLKAHTRQATYDSIRYWVSKERRVGVKADYYTVSGKKFKTAAMTYAHELTGDGGVTNLYISKMAIRNVLLTDDVTTLSFSEPVLKEVPHHTFDLNLLTR